MTMTPEEKRIKIAECLGAKWHSIPPEDGTLYHPKRVLCFDNIDLKHPHFMLPIPEPETGDALVCIPDYLNSLDAMAQAEATLKEGERRTYFYHLFGAQRLDDGDLWKAVHATATQRADAFLKVKGII